MNHAVLDNRLRAIGVVPVVTIRDAADAPALGAALIAGGLPVAEITFRTDAAAAAIAALRDTVPDVLVGAGTVLDVSTLRRAATAGAAFAVTPGFNPVVVDAGRELGLPVIPGISSPTDIEAALARDIRLVKFFPAEAAGGLAFLKAVAGPYRDVSFMPTGGITPANLPDYLAQPFVAACGGSWIATEKDITDKRFDAVAAAAATAAALVARVRRPSETRSA
ncbi:bifunctional 4-hydroxy-2-oxoglutarate aldolase/2-dehydro-3-deoxy-phosphogluconate aldolase [Nakamurella sp.]|uniref:bifunctional 4-hydroxy-2-oxoglutarate aldolase/2-dehydro-3-deoxy-phosphogluconate aldolase n=1 Tax=Nakamurella sp. TaxID=1869182 RepID=UPI003B3BBF00